MSQRPLIAQLHVVALLAAFSAVAQAQELGFRALQPCRLVDTRPNAPLLNAQARSFLVSGLCGVPHRFFSGGSQTNQAVAVALNVVAVGAGGAGHLTAWPANKPIPHASTINYSTGQTIANGIIVPMCDEIAPSACEGGDISFMAAVSPVHLVVDVVGYFAVPVVPGSVRYGSTGIESALCFNQTTGIRFGLSHKIGSFTDAYRLCPAGTWLCSLAEMGTAGCNTARPDGTCDSIECNGACQDLATNNHRGWIHKASTSTTSALTFSEGASEVSGGMCQYNPAWCCSR